MPRGDVIRTVIWSVIVTDIQIGRLLMTVQTTTIDQEMAQQLSVDFHRCLSHHEARQDLVARRIHLCEVADDRICAVVTYCNGGWDADLRARHAAEAPMVEGRS